MTKLLLKKTLSHFGYRLVKDNSLNSEYDLADEALKAQETVSSHTMLTPKALISLWQQVSFIEKNNIPGCFVECGVWKGGAVGVMALANLHYSKKRRDLHLFDAFDDICAPDIAIDGDLAISEVSKRAGVAPESLKGQLEAVKGVYNIKGGHGTEKEAKELILDKIGYNPENVHFYKGWFQDTLPQYADKLGPIALLRLDGDWYASTKTCLENLFDKVVPGGFVVIDDYGTYEGCRIATDEFLKKRNLNLFLNHVSSDCRYLIKP